MIKKILFLCMFCYIFTNAFDLWDPVYAKTDRKVNHPKNIIFLIGDGMGVGQIEIARMMEYGTDGTLFLQTLPFSSMAHTGSANNFVTDSAAGGTALAIGQKTNNGMIGMTPNGKPVDSILDSYKKHGKKTGIVTTNSVTDATPASFTASVKDRWKGQKEIARQQLENKVDVILGGGAKYFYTMDKSGTILLDHYKQAGYEFVETKEQLKNASRSKILGLFNTSHLTFKLDREELNSKEPSLTEMTEKALETLSKEDKGFFVMVEGARIDHASHSADMTSVWKETIEFDDAVKYAVKWAEKNKDTLVVVAADHETMGISLTEPLMIEALKKIAVTPHYMTSQLKRKNTGKGYTKDSIKKVFHQFAHMELSDKEIELFNKRIISNDGKVYPEQQVAWEIGHYIARYHHAGIIDRRTEELSSTGGHTGNMIMVFAYGVGAARFQGVMDNTDIPKILSELSGYSL